MRSSHEQRWGRRFVVCQKCSETGGVFDNDKIPGTCSELLVGVCYRSAHTAQQIGPLPIQNRNSVPAGCRNPAVAQRRSDRWSCFGPQDVFHMRLSANGPNVRHSFSAIGILILPYATMATPSPPSEPPPCDHPTEISVFNFTFVSRYAKQWQMPFALC